MTQSLSALDIMRMYWRYLLPESRHAWATLQELANIADFVEKKSSDVPLRKMSFGRNFSDFYPTIISWLCKEVSGMVFACLLG